MVRALACLLAMSAACGGDDAPDAGADAATIDVPPVDASGDAPVDTFDADVRPRIELGTGAMAFEAVPTTGEPTLPLIFGPQGGWHLEAAVRLLGVDPEGLVLEYETTDAAEGTVLSFPTRVELSEARVRPEGDHHVRVGDLVIFDIFAAEEVVHRVVDVTVVAFPASGAMLTDARRVTVGLETR